jgi:HAD superfamily phosphoserine phosphatase-like hydrolase
MKRLALFDFDKTIISVDSIVEFKKYCIKEGFKVNDFKKSSLEFNISNELQNQLNKQNWLLSLRGIGADEFNKLCEKFIDEVIITKIIPDVLNYLIKLKSENIDLIILSATYSKFINLFFDKLNIKDITVISNEIKFESDKLSPEFIDLNCSGINKFILLNKRINLFEYDLYESYGFTDHISDISFLSLVGKRFVVKNNETKDNWSEIFKTNYIYY